MVECQLRVQTGMMDFGFGPFSFTQVPSPFPSIHLRLLLIDCGCLGCCLHIGRSGGTSDNFDQLAGNDGLASTVEENLVLADHLAGVLGSVLDKG